MNRRREIVIVILVTALSVLIVVGFVLSQGGPPTKGVKYESVAPKD